MAVASDRKRPRGRRRPPPKPSPRKGTEFESESKAKARPRPVQTHLGTKAFVWAVMEANFRVCTAAIGSICAISSDPEFLLLMFVFVCATSTAFSVKGFPPLHRLLGGVLTAFLSIGFLHRYIMRKKKEVIDRNNLQNHIEKDPMHESPRNTSISPAAKQVWDTADVVVHVMSFLRLRERARLSCVSFPVSRSYSSASLWADIVVPDVCESINMAVKAIPQALQKMYPWLTPRIWIRPGTYWEGDPRGRLSVLFQRRPSGVYVNKRVRMEALVRGIGNQENVDRQEQECKRSSFIEAGQKRPHSHSLTSTSSVHEDHVYPDSNVHIRSNAGEAITISSEAAGTILKGLRVSIDRFSSHGIAIYADDVTVDNCTISATGTNACGLLVGGRSVRGLIKGCSVHRCGGSGVLLAYNTGPLAVEGCEIHYNRWSGIGAFAGSSLSVRGTSIRNNALFAVGAAVDVLCELGDENEIQGNGRGDSVHRYLAYEHT